MTIYFFLTNSTDISKKIQFFKNEFKRVIFFFGKNKLKCKFEYGYFLYKLLKMATHLISVIII